MPLSRDYRLDAPTKEQLETMQGALVLEFGIESCSFCRAAQPSISSALVRRPGVPHLKVDDSPGRALGRSFDVTALPTLVFLVDGREVARVVRPEAALVIDAALKQLEPTAAMHASF